MTRYRAVYNFLLHERDWVTSSEIREITGITPQEVRELCQEFPAVFVSSPHGYKLARNASAFEIRDCVQSLLSRASKITTRAAALAGRLG